jgi:peroxiredoxin
MNTLRRIFGAVVLISNICCVTVSRAAPAEDIRDKVRPVTESHDSTIDLKGIVFGVPFGASEEGVFQKFGKPAGYIRLDAHRTALLYGQAYALLCYDGSFDAVRIGRSIMDWNLSGWITETAPFTTDGWQLSDGVRPEMSLKEVLEITKAQPGTSKYLLGFSTDQCSVQLTFSHRVDFGTEDDAYTVFGLLMDRKHKNGDYWNQQQFRSRSFAETMKGKKMLGLNVGDSLKGIRVITVYKNSPADKAQIKPGDLITALNGKSTVGMISAEFSLLAAKQDTDSIEVTSRDGARRTVAVQRADGGTLTGALAGERLALSEVSEGDMAPDFEAKYDDGKPVKLSGLKGSPVLINFTATLCGPCKKETPALVSIYAKYKNRGLKVISVYLDSDDVDVFRYAKNLSVTWPINTDGKGWENAVARTYGVTGVPTNVLIGKDGRIRNTNVSGLEMDSAIESALK